MLVMKIAIGIVFGVVLLFTLFRFEAKVEVQPSTVTPVGAPVTAECVSPVGEPTQVQWCQNVLGDYNLNGIADRDE